MLKVNFRARSYVPFHTHMCLVYGHKWEANNPDTIILLFSFVFELDSYFRSTKTDSCQLDAVWISQRNHFKNETIRNEANADVFVNGKFIRSFLFLCSFESLNYISAIIQLMIGHYSTQRINHIGWNAMNKIDLSLFLCFSFWYVIHLFMT